MSSEEIVLPTTPLDPKLPTAVFQPVHDQAAAILARGITLTIADPVGNRTWSVPSAVLQDSLVLKTSPYSLDVQSDVFSPLVSQIAKDLARSPIDATLSVKDDLVRLTSDQVGWQVDQTATLASLRARILASGDTTGVVVNAVQAKVRISDLSPTATEVSTIIAKGIKLSVGGKVGGDGNEAVIQTLAATPAEVGNMLVIKPGLDGKLTISIDADRVSQLVDRLSLQYQYPSLTARFVTWNGTKAQVKVGAKIPAILIDKPKAVAAIAAGWRGGTVSVGTVFGEMTVDQAFADRLTADLKGVFKTRSISFAVSSPERAHNISLALSRINGTIVAPGEVYSFNISTGPTTIAAGYTWGFAFLTDKKTGQNLVVPSEAGGICQVATSVFQPVYLSGYTIEERNYHMFNLRSYAVNGYYGLDATVYPPYADMKFRNDTSQYLMISAGTRGRATYVGLVGTKPNWTVSLSKERIYDVKAPPPEPIMTTSDLFAAGRTITLEHPTNGFTTEVTRTVTYPDGTVRTLTLKSKYLPTPLQVLVGTGTSNPH
jgi:vancomycin resistance protein YoaR